MAITIPGAMRKYVVGGCILAALVLGGCGSKSDFPFDDEYAKKTPEEKQAIEAAFKQKPEAEQREIIHRTFDKNNAYHAAIRLIEVGDETSVPYLLSAIKGRTPVKELTDLMYNMSQSACLQALTSITNHNPASIIVIGNHGGKTTKTRPERTGFKMDLRKPGFPFIHRPMNNISMPSW